MSTVWAELGLVPSFPIITVGGTNGKGSTCAMLEAILSHVGISRRLLHFAAFAAL